MQGRSATILLLTLATFLDELLDLASVLSSEHTPKPHLSHLRHHSSSPHARPSNHRWWPILAAAGSPVIQPESQVRPIIRQGEHNTAERIRNGDAHTTQTRWALDNVEPNPQLESQRLLELEESESDVRPGSNAPMGWADPRLRGGQMLDVRIHPLHLAHINTPHHRTYLIYLTQHSTYLYRSGTHAHTQFVFPGLGEPLNVIISGLSDPYILTPRGLLHYVQTLGFSTECLGIHLGMLHVANLGDALNATPSPSHGRGNDDDDDDRNNNDGNGPTPPRIPPPNSGGNKTEQLLARQNYDWPQHGWPDYGTCLESLIGGNHFRAWKQDGAGARTGAWFLAWVSLIFPFMGGILIASNPGHRGRCGLVLDMRFRRMGIMVGGTGL